MDILVLAPHQDDETFGCGGTIKLHTLAGDRVVVAFLTDGRASEKNLSESKAEALVLRREREAEKACRILGVGDKLFFRCRDGFLEGDESVAALIKDLIALVQPSIIYFPFSLDWHPDHRAVSGMLEYNPDIRYYMYEVTRPLFYPDHFVVIDRVIQSKLSAMMEYASQNRDFPRYILGLNAYRSFHKKGSIYCEAFQEWKNEQSNDSSMARNTGRIAGTQKARIEDASCNL